MAAYNLHKSLLKKGINSLMLVNNKISNDSTVVRNKIWFLDWINALINNKVNFLLSYSLGIFLRMIYKYYFIFYKSFLLEKNFIRNNKHQFFYTFQPDIIHFHDNQLNNYDLKTIKKISINSNVVFSLHDLWLFTGHCGVPLDCDKYKTWCGECPNLKLPPRIYSDNTRESIIYKFNEINLSRINFLTHSRFVHDTILSLDRYKKNRFDFINYAVDTSKFKSKSKAALRNQMGISNDLFILMTNAVSITENPYKDFNTLYKAFQILAGEYKKKIMLLVVGDKISNFNNASKDENILFVDPFPQSEVLINYYSIADIYVHSSNIETWGLAISEALACGLPVIASAVGAVSEQIRGLSYKGKKCSLNKYTVEEANGFLFERKNYLMLYDMIKYSKENKKIIRKLSKNSNKFAQKYLNIDKSVSAYLDYYKCIIESQASN